MMVEIERVDALDAYGSWADPHLIVSDGPYGLLGRGGFEGDSRGCGRLVEWYRPHVEAWTRRAQPCTALWFWASELAWATVHPLLDEHRWEYRACNVWNKGVGHVAGRSNTQTLRTFPVVTEVCVHYTRPVHHDPSTGESRTTQQWMRDEWQRTGLPFTRANDACGVANAATRKYLASDHCWYFPPQDVFERLVAYANEHGDPAGRPYFSLNGLEPAARQRLQARFDCPVGVTNVWDCPPVRGRGRMKVAGVPCPNQKPLSLVRRLVQVSSGVGDVVWEPFGGSCPTAVACRELGRRCHAAEIERACWEAAARRLWEMG